jgi:hypothetical protein
MLKKSTLHFHDFDRMSKTYPLRSFKIKKGGSGYKKRGVPVFEIIILEMYKWD